MPNNKIKVVACELVAPVFQQYERELLSFIKKRLKDSGESEEVLNQILMKVYQHCEKLPDIQNTRAWLYQITRNAIYDYFKEKQRRQYLDETVELREETDDSIAQSLEPLIPAMIRMLPEAYGIPLQMSDLEGIPQKEIAEKLGLSLSGAKSRIQRGREKLKALFFECCHLELDQRGVPVSFAVKEHCKSLLAYQPSVEVVFSSKRSCNC